MQRLRNLLVRPVGGSWHHLVCTILITCLVYGLGLILLYPFLGVGARTLSFPFVWFWGWRKGLWGGVVAALVVDLVVADIFCLAAGLALTQLPQAFFYIINNAVVGGFVGRLSDLGGRLRLELVERKHVELLLRESEGCYRMLFENNPHPMWVLDLQTLRLLAVNEAAIQHYGYSAEEFAEMSVEKLLTSEGIASLRSILKNEREMSDLNCLVDRKHLKKDGTLIDVEITSHRVTFLGREARLALSHDVTERKKAQAKLEHQALHDSLTGLPNRACLQRNLDRMVLLGQKEGITFALLLVDLDRFKEINDTLGHQYGDLVLQQLSPRLRKVLRDSDMLARLGGDEFAIILADTDQVEALAVAKRLLEAIEEPFHLDGQVFDVGASIGIAVYPDHAQVSDVLLRLSDIAMYAAKNSRRGAVVYTRAVHDWTAYAARDWNHPEMSVGETSCKAEPIAA
jgi:diguanylate cyclase (GGDEF)-like protein/PAS domain S-box-containing protein